MFIEFQEISRMYEELHALSARLDFEKVLRRIYLPSVQESYLRTLMISSIAIL